MSEEKLPILKPIEVITVLERLGFLMTRKSRGSHFRYCHPDGRKTTVSVHKGKDISRGLSRKILRDINISPVKFKELL
ncbi:type II toxin-antitoxin system HicA family toxin [bacterium]|nr:type II toxin-antitoxin system HicA family toxin [bacterium]MBU1487222.1 type II toxin-antitoxin system HicA family toxin [bacterium]MBU2461414.1 type II toxin-antitoxin system HicA family toxin [bacterium]